MKHVIIVGGSLTGWYTALALQKHTDLHITLIDSNKVSKLPVGESLNVDAKDSFKFLLGLEDEKSWMQKCGAIFKYGMFYNDFVDQGKSYGSSHQGVWKLSSLANRICEPLIDETNSFDSDNLMCCILYLIKTGKLSYEEAREYTNMSSYFVSNPIAPYDNNNRLVSIEKYSYHIDSDQFVNFIKTLPKQRITHITKHISDIIIENDSIKELVFEDGNNISGDFYVDGSGFSRLLISKMPSAKFIDLSDKFNNCAVVVPTKYTDPEKEMRGCTEHFAYECGYGFKIRLYHRIGNGIIFNDSVTSKEQATDALLSKIDKATLLSEPRFIKWRSGHYESPWINNVLAIGQSAGFIEPWDANQIYRLSMEIRILIDNLKLQNLTNKQAISVYNKKFLTFNEEIKERIKLSLASLSKNSTYWDWFKNNHNLEFIKENIKGTKYHYNPKMPPWTSRYYRHIINRNLDISDIDIPEPSPEEIELTLAFIQFNRARTQLMIKNNTTNYYAWLKDNIYNGRTCEQVYSDLTKK
jgi:tryptophan halogenase